VADLAK